MIIKNIRASNFKTFNDLNVDLNQINILIGANASGKSNFTDVFRFIRDISNHGLKNAISMQGGLEYLRNIHCNIKDIHFKIQLLGENDIFIRKIKRNWIAIKANDLTYSFTLSYKDKLEDVQTSDDELFVNFEFFKLKSKKDLKDEKKLLEKIKTREGFLDKGSIIIKNSGGEFKYTIKTPESIPDEEIIPSFLTNAEFMKYPKNTLIIEKQILEPPLFPIPPFVEYLKNISIYDFDPKLSKRAVPITGKKDLEEDGSNLAIALKNITDDPNNNKKFTSLTKDILPFIDNLKIEKLADRSFFFKLSEIYAKDTYFPASSLSDGTINIAAIITALYFEEKPFIIVEEPERNIHPYLISRVVGMLKDASKNKQIIITTHNPQIVKHSNIKDILLISRDSGGFSEISRPAENEEVISFLKENLGIEELFVNSFLE